MSTYYVIYLTIAFFIVISFGNFFSNYSRFNKLERGAYFATVSVLLFWVITNAGADLISDYDLAFLLAKLALFPPLIFMFFMYQISVIFPQTYERSKSEKNISFSVGGIVLFVTLINLVFVDTQLNLEKFELVQESPSFFVPGPLYYLNAISVFILAGLTFLNWDKKKLYYTYTQKLQVRFLKASILLFLIYTVLGFTVLPVLNLTQYTPFSFMGIILFLFLVQRNLVIKNVALDPVDFMKKFGLAIIGLVLSSAYLYVLFSFYESDSNILVLFAGITFLIASIVYIYLKVSSVLFGAEKKNEENVLEFVEFSGTTLSKKDIINKLTETLNKLLQAGEVKYDFSIERSNLYIKFKDSNLLSQNNYVFTPEVLLDYLFKVKETNSPVAYLYNYFRESDIQIFLPLGRGKNIFGFVFVSHFNKVLEESVIKYLQTLTINAYSAILRADLYEKSLNFNQTLQQKITEATAELQTQKAQLEEKYQFEKDMMGIMGHELRTPMTVAKGMAEMLITKSKTGGKIEPDYLQDKLTKVYTSVVKESDLIQTMLSTSHIDNNKMNFQFSNFSIIELIDFAMLAFKKDAETKGLILKFEKPEGEVPEICSDQQRVQEIVNNLISNAIKYTNEGRVTVSLSVEDKFLKFVVKDTGIGIPEAEIKNVGKKFYRIHQHLDDKKQIVRAGGTGLGLYVVKGLLHALGGELLIESKENVGSTFTAVMPIECKPRDGVVVSEAPIDQNDMFQKFGFKKSTLEKKEPVKLLAMKNDRE